MRFLIGWGAVLAAVCIVWGLYLVNTSPGVEDGSQMNSLVTLPAKVAALPQVSSLPQSPDMSFVFDDSPPQNIGEALDADDMSFVFDDSPPQNIGEALDADDMSFIIDDSPPQNVGAALDAEYMSFVYDDSPQQNVGAALDADAQ
jgi:hypothetical protein